MLAELSRLRSAGLAIGLTVSGPRQADTIRRALDVHVEGSNPFQVVQATWNLLEPSAGPALLDAKRAGWGVIVKEALANGRLTDRGASLPMSVQRCAAARDATIDAVAIAAALAQPWADVVLSGAVTAAQLASNLTALELADGPALEWPVVAEPASEYWARRASLEWR